MGGRHSLKRLIAATTAAIFLVASLAVSVALASSDADMDAVIKAETDKAATEILGKAAELKAKGEWPKTGKLTERSLPCVSQASTQPFLKFGDMADYTPLPGGSFEQGATGWLLENTAYVASQNSPFSTGKRSLAIPKGARVSTSAVCITEFHPTIRFFARVQGSLASRLRVEALYEDISGSVNTQTVGWLRPTSAWGPTAIVSLRVNVRAAVAQSRTAAIAFRFSAEDGEGTWYVDDIYVDPFKSH